MSQVIPQSGYFGSVVEVVTVAHTFAVFSGGNFVPEPLVYFSFSQLLFAVASMSPLVAGSA
jgi:hypothetical protein